MNIIPICPGSAMANCYLLVHGTHALVADPCVTVSSILRAAEHAGAVIEGILLTHGHFDHILSLDSLREALSVPAYLIGQDQILLPDGQKNAFSVFFGQDRAFRPAEKSLQDSDVIPLGDAFVHVIHTPGHTAGSACYLTEAGLLTGDTIFADSFGRYDLYSGDLNTLKASLCRLAGMPPATPIYPGHGESTTLGEALANVRRMLRF